MNIIIDNFVIHRTATYSNWLMYVISDNGKVQASQDNGASRYLIKSDQVIRVDV